MIVRTTRDADARYKLVSLTKKAKRNHPLGAVEFQEAERKATEGISQEDLNVFLLVAEA